MDSLKTTFEMVEPTQFQIVSRRPSLKRRRKAKQSRGRKPSEASMLLAQGKTLLFPGNQSDTERSKIVGKFYAKHSYLKARGFDVHTMAGAKGIYIWADKKKAPKLTPVAVEG